MAPSRVVSAVLQAEEAAHSERQRLEERVEALQTEKRSADNSNSR